MIRSRFQFNLAWVTLIYTLPVIMFGAFVRASGSGDGCGTSWPTCEGALWVDGSNTARAIEFTHRVSSGIVLPLMFILMWLTFKFFEKGHLARKAITTATLFTIFEALIGAKIVLRGLTGDNDSIARVVVMSIHLVNVFFLLGALAALIYASAGKPLPARRALWNGGAVGLALSIGLAGQLLLAASGGVTALGDTLFPANSFEEILNQTVDAETHILIFLRKFHPFIATSVGVLVLLMARFVIQKRPFPLVRRWGNWTVGLFWSNMLIGVVNLAMLAPITMQMIHLLLSNLVWMAFVIFGLAALAYRPPVEEEQSPEASDDDVEPDERSPRAGDLVKAYIALTKPRVISLLLFTTVAAMVMAERGWPGGWLVLLVCLGGYMAAGAANTYNMIVERDLDVAMDRTAKRPTVSGAISSRSAFIFASALTIGSFTILTVAANVLAASLALAGLLFYVFIYTLLLKRRTWQNIVIGGAAGAFPPLVGYAAVTGMLNPFAWFLFAVIFLWTPVHFWALAIMIKDDYARAGVPMLPVVKGDHYTVVQIAIYSVLTALFCIVPLFQATVSWVYIAGAVLLNLGLVAYSFKLLLEPSRPRAKALFKYSMVYLAALFLVLAIDQAVMIA